MFSIFLRFTDIISSKISAMLDKFKNPVYFLNSYQWLKNTILK